MITHKSFVLLIATLLAVLADAAAAQNTTLGKVDFSTSAQSPKAQDHFLRGVAALHSFWYPVALEEFRASTKIEPDFLMGYWGEAMAHNHPIWGDPQDAEAAREVLENIKDISSVTPRTAKAEEPSPLAIGLINWPQRETMCRWNWSI
jgi:hypothetical protein